MPQKEVGLKPLPRRSPRLRDATRATASSSSHLLATDEMRFGEKDLPNGAKLCRRLRGQERNADAGPRINANAYNVSFCFGPEPMPRSVSHSLILAPITSG